MAHAVMDNFPNAIPKEDDFYAALGCTEHSSVSINRGMALLAIAISVVFRGMCMRVCVSVVCVKDSS